MKHLILSVLLLICAATSQAQDIEIKGMKQVKATAEAAARKDINGINCGLVRVKMSEGGAEFEGNIIGDVAYNNGEYLVYMAKGSKRLVIKHPAFIPITIVFSDFNINSIDSDSEYQLSTKLHPEKEKKDSKKRGFVTFCITPTDVLLSIDDKKVPSSADGIYNVNLPLGTHYYSVSYDGFTINNQVATIEKQPKIIQVNLTDFLATLNVECGDTDAEIYINDELRGEGSWHGMIAPGRHIIQVQKEGCRSLSQTISLNENESFLANFDKLKYIGGSLIVNYEPVGDEVYIDGEKMGTTPLKVERIKAGRHRIMIKNKHNPMMRDVVIQEDQELEMKGRFPMTIQELVHNDFQKGDGDAFCIIGLQYMGYSFFDGGPDGSAYAEYQDQSDYDLEELSNNFFEENIPMAIDWFRANLGKKYHYRGNVIDEATPYLALSNCYIRQKKYDESFKLIKECESLYKGTHKILYWYLAWHYYFGYGTNRDLIVARKYMSKLLGNSFVIGDGYWHEATSEDIVEESLIYMNRKYGTPDYYFLDWHF